MRKLNLSYVASDFCVRIITDDQFAVEREQLIGVGLAKIVLPVALPASEEIAQWSAGHTNHVARLDGKLHRMKRGSSEAATLSTRDRCIHAFNALQKKLYLFLPVC